MQRRAGVLTNGCMSQLLLPASNIRNGILCQQPLFSLLGNPKKQSMYAKKRRPACFFFFSPLGAASRCTVDVGWDNLKEEKA